MSFLMKDRKVKVIIISINEMNTYNNVFHTNYAQQFNINFDLNLKLGSKRR